MKGLALNFGDVDSVVEEVAGARARDSVSICALEHMHEFRNFLYVDFYSRLLLLRGGVATQGILKSSLGCQTSRIE